MQPRPDVIALARSIQSVTFTKNMTLNSIRTISLGLLAGLLLSLSSAPAQTTNPPAASKKPAGDTAEPAKHPKTPGAGPFHGKLVALDKLTKSITVGKRTFQITSETKIRKSGKPATLEDGVVGEPVSGYIKPGPAGKLVATTVNFGAKPSTEGAKKKETQTEQ